MKYALMSGNNAVLPGSRLRSENANFVMHHDASLSWAVW